MIKVTLLYPNSEDSHFDAEYYCNMHTPMVQSLFGSACKGTSVDIGLSSNQKVAFHAIGNYLFESVEAFESAMAPHAQKIMQDATNYTNIEPIIQISEARIALKGTE